MVIFGMAFSTTLPIMMDSQTSPRKPESAGATCVDAQVDHPSWLPHLSSCWFRQNHTRYAAIENTVSSDFQFTIVDIINVFDYFLSSVRHIHVIYIHQIIRLRAKTGPAPTPGEFCRHILS